MPFKNLSYVAIAALLAFSQVLVARAPVSSRLEKVTIEKPSARSFKLIAEEDWFKISADEYSMSNPPKEGSAAYKEDFKLLHQYQDGDRKEECALAKKQVHPTYEAFFIDSPLLTMDEYNAAEALVTRTMKYAEKIAGVFKEEHMRPRPYDADESLEPCAKKPGGSKSYPSSHAASAVVASCVLGKIYPSKAASLKEYGKKMGDVRAVVGVHHPSDVKAGQKLGADICNRLMENSAFVEEIEALK